MAITAATVWEVRTGGSANNGGGYDAALGGTDYSQQAAAQVAYTDLVIDATTNTKCTSAGNPFTSSHVGNVINITGGTGFTVQRVQVVSVAAGVATCDKSLGTLSSTGGTGNLGGALASIEDADAVYVGGNTIYVESGTYTKTTTRTLTADGTATAQIRVIGYPSGGSRSDQDTTEANMPILTSATNSIALITFNAAPWWSFRNIKFTHSAATRGSGVVNATAGTAGGPVFRNCVWDGCLNGYNIGNTGATAMTGAAFYRCTFRNSTSHGVSIGTGSGAAIPFVFDGCDFSANAGAGITTGTGCVYSIFVRRCVFRGQTGASGHGIWFQETTATWSSGVVDIDSCDFYSNAQSGIRFDLTTGRPSIVSVTNNVLVSNGAYGLSCATTGILNGTHVNVEGNAFYNNTSGARQNFSTGTTDVTLTGSPFTNAGSGDFTLNNTASAGAACRSVAFPAAVGPSGATVGSNYQDIGPLQAQATAGGGTVAYGFAG